MNRSVPSGLAHCGIELLLIEDVQPKDDQREKNKQEDREYEGELRQRLA